ncbi:MAG: DUF2079 domain-containing protein [Acutalibacteraceae bacterium]|nr:DUF2079 domain-containing protein [Acutalibacteraceae bacterium]
MEDNNNQKNNLVKRIDSFLKIIPLDYLFATFCAGFCFSSFCTLLTADVKYTDISFVPQVNLELVLITTLIIFLALVFTSIIINNNKIIPVALLSSAILFGCTLAFEGSYTNEESSKNIFMNIAIGLVMFFIVAWICKDDKLDFTSIKLPKHTKWIVAVGLLVLFTVFVSIVSISRYSGYLSHNFDFGIFAQMFENMRTTGLADTTVERNTLMSHFGVHFSPFYYLLLPLYMICPRPEMLLVIQAMFVAFGIIPVVLICKKLNLTQSVTIMCSIMYIFFPTLSNGCLYDFHENKFLTVLIMWAMYFIISNKWIGTVIFCILTLTVKEDAAIYVMSIALYIILTRKQYLTGGMILGGAAVYFVFATSMVASLGDGVMTDRLANYMAEGETGFGAVIKTCVADFGYFLSQVFTADKIMFMVWMLLPVAFAPFMSEKKSLLVLLIPMLVVDLMSNWQYQYDVKFQYTYGVAALIVFMAILVISQSKKGTQNKILIYSVSMCIIMCFSLFFPRSAYYMSVSESNKSMAEEYNSLIATIPTDVEITADGIYIPHMYNFKNLYQYPNYYAESVKTEYLLVGANNVSNNTDDLATFMGNDYELVSQSGDMCLYKMK